MVRRAVLLSGLLLAVPIFAQEKTSPPTAGASPEPAAAAHDAAEKSIDSRADAALHRMCDYLQKLSEFRYVSEVETDQVARDGQKIQLSRRVTVELKRPNLVHAVTQGDNVQRESFFDGDKCTILDLQARVYSIVDTPNTLEGARDYMAEKYDMEMPNSDILMSDPYKELSDDVLTGKYIGLSHVGDTACHHLAFTQASVDWQIWIATGDKPLPRKMIVTYKKEPASPQFVAIYTKWETEPKLDRAIFTATPKRGFHQVELQPLDSQQALSLEPARTVGDIEKPSKN